MTPILRTRLARLLSPRLPSPSSSCSSSSWRAFTTAPALRAAFDTRPRPSPPRLPKEQQEEFERLQRESTGAFQTSNAVAVPEDELLEGEHPDLRRGAKPEFAGERNPKTGEIGGPKNEPLRWGGEGEWTYNGRATDF